MLLVIFLLTRIAGLSEAVDEEPLLFQVDKEDPRLVAIYWNQNYRLKKVKEISSREVYYNGNESARESYDQWQPLLVDEEDAKKVTRFVLIRNELCREKDFRVSWFDQQNDDQLHEQMVRLGPSPLDWSESFQFQVGRVQYQPADDSISGQLSSAALVTNATFFTVETSICKSVFTNWVSRPRVDPQSGKFVMSADYVRHGCELTVQLNKRQFDARDNCWQLYKTDQKHSGRLQLQCDQVDGMPCPMEGPELNCRADCGPSVQVLPMAGGGKAFVRASWQFEKANTPPGEQVLRTAEVDYAWNNNPVAMFNLTTIKIRKSANATSSYGGHVDLEPFSKMANSYYAMQVCAVYEDNCADRIDWKRVAPRPIYVAQLLRDSNLLNDSPTEEAHEHAAATTQQGVSNVGKQVFSNQSPSATRLPPSAPTAAADGRLDDSLKASAAPSAVGSSALVNYSSFLLTTALLSILTSLAHYVAE